MIFDIDYDKLRGKKIAGIYKITNLKNNKIYIGQSKHLRHRISDYIHIHEREKMTHPIALAIKEDGTDNFKFEIIEFCDESKLSELELFYIKKYNSVNPKIGYNKILHTTGADDVTSKLMSDSHIGLKESTSTKRKKSNPIFIFTRNHNSLIISDSGKLFGSFIGKSKDMIKNSLRQPSSINGFYVYYADYDKRNEIYYKMLGKRSIRNLQFVSDMSLLNKLMDEGVETIYQSFNVYRLSYDDTNLNGRPILNKISNGYDFKESIINGNEIKYIIDKELADDTTNLIY